MSLQLFRVDFEAATAHERPTFWPKQSGYLSFYLFASDPQDAGARAKIIAETLPYVLLETSAVVHELDGPRMEVARDDEDPQFDRLSEAKDEMETVARRVGFAFAFAPISRAEPPRVSSSKMIRLIFHESSEPNENA